MCSITDQLHAASRGPRLTALIAHTRELTTTIGADLAEPDADADLAVVPVDVVAAHARDLLAAADAARAAAAVLTGVVDRAVAARHLIDGTYASTKRWLEAETGMSGANASAFLARARDLRDAADDGDPRVRLAWLSGSISDDVVRELTVGVRTAITHLPAAQRGDATRHALDVLLPLAQTPGVGVASVRRAIGRLRYVLDPDGARQAELDAYTDQSLVLVPVGHLVKLTAWLEPHAAAAIMTVLDQQVTGWLRDDDLAPEERLPDGVDPDSAEGRRLSRQRISFLHALALGETMTGLLDRAEIGLHHGIRPHTVLHVDARDLHTRLGGMLTLPGSDEAHLVSPDTVRRILCDTSLTPVITQPAGRPVRSRSLADMDRGASAAHGVGEHTPGPHATSDSLADLLRDQARDVLYVGREARTAPPGPRRALETRDRHCQAPGCRRSPRRCHAHHVTHWTHGGTTAIDNCLLLCERHHRALHADQLTITHDTTKRPTETGYFRVHPPERQPQP
jgi:hypothetical protein